jgi:hypothetical protein
MFENISTLPLKGDWKTCLEAAYLEDFFKNLQEKIGSLFKIFHFHILHLNLGTGRIDLPHFGKNHILLWLSDESSQLPEDIPSKFGLVLKSYHLPKNSPPNVLPFPLCGSSAVIHKEPSPFGSRHTSVFFSGNLNKNRAELFYRLKFHFIDIIPCFPNSILIQGILSQLARKLPFNRDLSYIISDSTIIFNQTFRSGFAENEYAKILSDSRICICPRGFSTPETIRHYEAMRLGCVLLSSPLPNSPYYFGSPIIEIPSWRNIRKKIISMLSNQEELCSISNATLNWWNERISPNAVAETVQKEIKRIYL